MKTRSVNSSHDPVLSIGVVTLIVLPLMATGLFVVYKVFGRRVRWSDPLQSLALLMCVLPAETS